MSDQDAATYLDAVSALIGLPIRQEHRDDVLAAFVVLTTQSRLITEFSLPEGVEAAPRFVP